MQAKKLKILVEKYWNGESSLEDENTLRTYFENNNFDDEYKDIAAVFEYHSLIRSVGSTISTQGNHVSDASNNSINEEDLDNLVDKYWNADSTLEEENTLREYFKNNKVHTKHKDIAAVFGYNISSSNITLNDSKITIPQLGGELIPQKEAKVFTLGRTLRALAAVFVLGFVAMMGYQQLNTQVNKSQFVNYVEVEDPEEALKYAEQALAILSNALSTGSNEVGNSMKVIDEMPVVGNKHAH